MTPQQTRYITSHSGDMKSKMRKEGLMVFQNDTKMRKEGSIMTQDNRKMPLRVLIQNMKESRGDPSLNWEQMTKGEKDVLHSAYKRIVPHELNPRPASRKLAKARRCKKATTAGKPSPVVLSLRSRRRAGDDPSGSGASPTQPQTIVVGDECEAEDDGSSIWDDEPAIGARNDVTFDACVDNAVRDVDSTNGHVSDSGNGNGIADDHNRGH